MRHRHLREVGEFLPFSSTGTLIAKLVPSPLQRRDATRFREPVMFNTTDLQRTLTAGIGAVLVSFAVIGATVAPVQATATTSTAAVVTDQASVA
jgi:hypothetical protein